MTNDEKYNYLNRIINNSQNNIYCGPAKLYKYRPFDEYTFEMIENNQIFLCPAEKEDDETECSTTLDIDGLLDLKTNNLKRECVKQIIDLIKPYTTEENYKIAREKILSIARKDGTIPSKAMLDLSFDLQRLVPKDVNMAPFINWIVNIPERLDDPEISSQLEPLFLIALNARKEVGICSLAESNSNEDMWKIYANNSTGYCIEYDVCNYENNINIFPVIYKDERESNIMVQIVASFVGQMINGFSNHLISADSSHFLRLFLTKNTMWEYQKEWRLLGKAGEKQKAPVISCIYLGENISLENEKKILRIAEHLNISIKK